MAICFKKKSIIIIIDFKNLNLLNFKICHASRLSLSFTYETDSVSFC